MSSEYAERAGRFLRAKGIDDFELVRRSRHPALVITYSGRTYLHPFPGTPSRKFFLNALSALRHQLGLVDNTRSTGSTSPRLRRRRRRSRWAPGASFSSKFRRALEPNRPSEDRYYARLAIWRVRLEAAARAEP